MSMTNREFLNNIINKSINAEVIQHAKDELDKLDKRNAARSGKNSAKQVANVPLMNKILVALSKSTEPVIGKALYDMNLDESITSVQKIGGLCGELVKQGKVTKHEVKIKGEGKRTGYKLVGTLEEVLISTSEDEDKSEDENQSEDSAE